jgi:hypothetical protein
MAVGADVDDADNRRRRQPSTPTTVDADNRRRRQPSTPTTVDADDR